MLARVDRDLRYEWILNPLRGETDEASRISVGRGLPADVHPTRLRVDGLHVTRAHPADGANEAEQGKDRDRPPAEDAEEHEAQQPTHGGMVVARTFL